MVPHVSIFALVTLYVMLGISAQRSPYLGSSDLGVLPMYLPEGSDNRFGGENENKEPPKVQEGTLETEDVFNRVSEWPDDRKPFWYLNAMAIQSQREKEQQQSQAAQAQSQA